MIEIEIPGGGPLRIAHIVCDYNGTLAEDGQLLAGVGPLIDALAQTATVHVVTADTFGGARGQLGDLPVTLTILPRGGQDTAKRDYVRKLGPGSVAAIGNGKNDALMLREAALGICLLQAEGASTATLTAADVCSRTAGEALELFLHPKRLVATLRR